MSIDVEKQIAYWRGSALEDMDTSWVLTNNDKYREALFFAHLSLEKALKALFVRSNKDIAPRTHNLVVLADRSRVELCTEQQVFLAQMNPYTIQGRYPDPGRPTPDEEKTRKMLIQVQEMVQWLIRKL